jgi:AMP-activated protein kinase-like protein
MPLPIEEEVHTPGSPISAPAEMADAVDDVDALDSDAMTRKSSALSNATIDEEEADELIVDKSQPSVATRLEWKRGGEKVYVTGSIFQWNRKHRLLPV